MTQIKGKKTDYVHARIDANLKKDVVDVLDKLGFSLSEFVKMSCMQLVHDQKLQFEFQLLREESKNEYTAVKDTEHMKSLIGYDNEN